MHAYTIKNQHDVDIRVFSLSNKNGFSVDVCEFGASLLKFTYPDKTDIIVGPKHRINTDQWSHFGSICGRVAGRIDNATFNIDDKHYVLEKNLKGKHHLHGGRQGLSKLLWLGTLIETPYGQAIEMTHTSPDGTGNYPGTVTITATYLLNDANELILLTNLTTDVPTIANITNHVYWNLHGVSCAESDFNRILAHVPTIKDHRLQINAHKYYEADAIYNVPTGNVLPVKNTALDFTDDNKTLHTLGERMDSPLCAPFKGYDHILVVDNSGDVPVSNKNIQFVAQLTNGERAMELWSSCPAVVLYTGNNLSVPHVSVCLETQFPADCPNHEHFPDITITPDNPWHQTTIWRFR